MKPVVTLIAVMVCLSGCVGQSSIVEFSEKMAADAAEDFIRNAPTYKWDGIDGSLSVKRVESLGCPGCFSVGLSFECAHGGYGDRTGQMVTQAIKLHIAEVVVENGVVTSARLDSAWDELSQKEIQGETPPAQTGTPFDASKALFLTFWTHKTGKTISGEVPIMAIDFPTYSFDESQSILQGMVTFEISDSLIAVLGVGRSLAGDAGMGAASMLYGIYWLPHDTEQMRIERILPDGTVFLVIDGKKITLAPGEEWKRTEVGVEDVGSGRLEYATTVTIVNHGWIRKTNIRKNPFSQSTSV